MGDGYPVERPWPPPADRPVMYGGALEPVALRWEWADTRLREARTYWVAATLADGRPHTRPVWGVWDGRCLYFSTGSRAAAVLEAGAAVTVHLDSGEEVVILEGRCYPEPDGSTAAAAFAAYNAKYHWDLDPAHPPGPLLRVDPSLVLAWVSDPTGLDGGALFHATATRWRRAGGGVGSPDGG